MSDYKPKYDFKLDHQSMVRLLSLDENIRLQEVQTVFKTHSNIPKEFMEYLIDDPSEAVREAFFHTYSTDSYLTPNEAYYEKGLSDPCYSVRCAAVSGMKKHFKVIPAKLLQKAMADPHSDVRSLAWGVVESKLQCRDLRSLSEGLGYVRGALRSGTLQEKQDALNVLVNAREIIWDDVFDAYDADPNVREDVAYFLKHRDLPDPVLRFMIESPHTALRLIAVGETRRLPTAVTDKFLDDPSPEVRAEAFHRLEICCKSVTEDQIRKGLADPDKRVADAAGSLLISMYRPGNEERRVMRQHGKDYHFHRR